ncbi:MAG: hypothetical protein R2745_21630 [Vicinamibacterales bacterium]
MNYRIATSALVVAVAIALAGADGAAAAPSTRTRDVCLVSPTGGGSLNTFILRDVKTLSPGGVIPLVGLYFVGTRKGAPLHGSAVMASDGSVRMGLFVHSSADSTNDFTAAGIVDATFLGTLKFDNDGDFVPNGTLAVSPVDCATIAIP